MGNLVCAAKSVPTQKTVQPASLHQWQSRNLNAIEPPTGELTSERLTPAAPRFSLVGTAAAGNGQKTGPEKIKAHEIEHAAAWNFTEISIIPLDPTNRLQAKSTSPDSILRGVIQPKLIIGAVDDPLERDADRVADHVMRMPEPLVTGASTWKGVLRRKCDCCEDSSVRLSAKFATASNHATSGHTDESVRQVLATPGEPLHTTTRAFFESRFGHDFGAIRIHTGEAATLSARSIGALAYTHGPHIVFAQGRYEPNSARGRHLLAHELTHTIQQQSGGRVRRAVNAAGLGISEWDARDSEPLQPGSGAGSEPIEGRFAPEEESSGPGTAVSAKPDIAVQRTPSSCPPYDGYSATRRIASYNCAGLAHRTYDFKSLADTQTLLAGGAGTGCGTACAAGKVKHWLWRYDIHLEDSSGSPVTATNRDFHTVAGVSTGRDPADVYTKNGARAIHGPGTGPSFKPPPRDQATTNDPSETPVTDGAGRPIYKVRQNFAESCHCLNCPSMTPPEVGPPPP